MIEKLVQKLRIESEEIIRIMTGANLTNLIPVLEINDNVKVLKSQVQIHSVTNYQ